jgi:ribonuclease BN (tRNA processing enzyme)
MDAAMEVCFPGSTQVTRRFTTELIELPERLATQVGPARVTTLGVKYPSGAPSYALRVKLAGKVITYSGDTAWTEALVETARRADLFICEAYFFDKQYRNDLPLQTPSRVDALIGAA